jgi:membrane protease YdiL (CAAX protease family)
MSTELLGIFTFGLLATLALCIGARRGFFSFPSTEWNVPLRLIHVIGAFAIYFFVSTLLAAFAVNMLRSQILANYTAYSSWFNFFVSFSIFLMLALYFRCLPKPIRSAILLRPGTSFAWQEDIWHAFYSWVLAFPLVLTLNQVLELVLLKVFHLPQLPDQIAVHFLKSTFQTPLYFLLAVLSIIVLAPLVEETLFRGFLQTYIRKHLGSKQAIVITSACFSLFHFSFGQGVGNISIILSLFVLALFLGFLYEKRGSLFASVVLHGTFNAVSVVNLYLFGGFTSHI